MPGSSGMVNETLREMMGIQQLQQSKRGCRLVFARLL